jgi:hypothetical protein
MLIAVLTDGFLVVVEPVILTEAEHEAEMREAGSRRFVQQSYEPPTVRDLERTPELDALFCRSCGPRPPAGARVGRFPTVRDIPRL